MSRSGRPRAATILAAALALVATGCPSRTKRAVYDLAERVGVADRWSSREVVLFGTPSAEPHLAWGFYTAPGRSDGDHLLWARDEVEVSLTWPDVRPRAAVVDLEPYRGVRDQKVRVSLNGAPVATFGVNAHRHRYRLTLRADAQRPGDNRLHFAFAGTATPAETEPGSRDPGHLAAAFFSLAVSGADDEGLDDLLARDAARPFSVRTEGGIPVLEMAGPSVVRYALRLPAGAELRFVPELHPAARRAGAAASFRVTLRDAEGGGELEAWSRVLRAADPPAGEIAVPLPGPPGSVVEVALHQGAAGGDRFAWGLWRAPRILGREGADPLEAAPLPREEERRADGLRRSLDGSNVVLVVLDAARARQLGCYGYGRATTPEIDRIATEGVLFERAFTPAVYTLGAMSSLWTSQHPDRHHHEVSFAARLPKDRLTLAELLSAQGIHTAGFVANAVAGVAFGFERGFLEFHEVFKRHGSGAGGFRRVLPAWLAARKDRRFFAYLHFREPHFPYDPEPPFDTRFGPDGPIPEAARSDAAFFEDVNQGRRRLSAEERDHLVRLYDGNLAFADQEVGALRRALEAEGLWEKTVVIITADHGEALGEHGYVGHNVELYETSVRVPLIIRFPSVAGVAGRRIAGLADLLDLAPTIAEVFGVGGKAGSDRAFQGRSLLPAIAGAPGKPAVLSRTVWERPRYGLRDERFKFVFDTRTGEGRLYDLVSDPDEASDIAARQPVRAAYYRQALHQWMAGLAREARAVEGPPLTKEQCENLRALGYVRAECP